MISLLYSITPDEWRGQSIAKNPTRWRSPVSRQTGPAKKRATTGFTIGGTRLPERTAESWHLVSKPVNTPVAAVNVDPDTALKPFSKSWRPADVIDKVRLEGDQALSRQVLEMVAVMARAIGVVRCIFGEIRPTF